MSWIARLGTDFKATRNMKDSAGSVFALTGHTVTAAVHTAVGGALVLAATVTVTGTSTLDVKFTDTQINTIGIGRYALDLKLVRASDSYVFRTRPVTFEVRSSVTV
jgi:hypothetical protein